MRVVRFFLLCAFGASCIRSNSSAITEDDGDLARQSTSDQAQLEDLATVSGDLSSADLMSGGDLSRAVDMSTVADLAQAPGDLFQCLATQQDCTSSGQCCEAPRQQCMTYFVTGFKHCCVPLGGNCSMDEECCRSPNVTVGCPSGKCQ